MTDFYAADVGRTITAGGGFGTITGYTDPETVTVEILQPFPDNAFVTGAWTIEGSPHSSCTPSAAGPVGAAITLTLGASGWRVEDVGKYVRINGGLCKITARTSATIVNARVEQELTAAVVAQTLAWSLEGSVWGGNYGYPRSGAFYQQRLWLGGSPGFPRRVWGSVIGEYFDFTLGTFDDDALAYDLAGGEYNPLLHLVSGQNLVALTSGGEFTIRGGQEKAITPTNIQVRDQSAHGANDVPPVRIGNEVLFAQRAGRKIRALTANEYDSEKYNAPDMAVLSEHITESGVVAMCYQQEPDTLQYVVRADGELATMTADRDQDVFAWTRQATQGRFESVCSVPAPEGDRVFAIVARTINGVVTRFVERFDPALHTDCALTGSSEAGAATWGGLAHLEGMLVKVKADGLVQADQFVIGGEITLGRNAYELEVGLNYVSTILTLPAEISVPAHPLAGTQLAIHEAKVRLMDSVGLRVNLQEVAFRNFGPEVLDLAPQPFSGDKVAGNQGWGDGHKQVLIQQVLPYPMHVLAVITKLTANEG